MAGSQSSNKNSTYDDISDETSATYTPGDDDVNRYVRAVASYTDDEGGSKIASSEAAYVKPEPDPNPAPQFQVNTSGGYSCSNNEAQMCLHVKRSDPDGSDIYYPASVYYPEDAAQKDNDQVRYSLGGDDAALFRIDPLRGTLFTKGDHTYNSKNTFEIIIIATDPSGQTGQVTAVIRPSGSANGPVVTGPQEIRYPENGTWSGDLLRHHQSTYRR